MKIRLEFRPSEYRFWILFTKVSAAASSYAKDSKISLSHITYTGQGFDNNCYHYILLWEGRVSSSHRPILNSSLATNFNVLSYQNFYSSFQQIGKLSVLSLSLCAHHLLRVLMNSELAKNQAEILKKKKQQVV